MNRSAIKSRVDMIEAMTPENKEAYLASGKVTVGTIGQLEKGPDGRNIIKTYYTAKIRGVPVGENGEWKHATREAALEYGREVKKQWQDELLAKQKKPVSTHSISGREVKITDMQNGKFCYETDRGSFGYVTATSIDDAIQQLTENFARKDEGPEFPVYHDAQGNEHQEF